MTSFSSPKPFISSPFIKICSKCGNRFNILFSKSDIICTGCIKKIDTRKTYHVKQDTHNLFLQIKSIIGKTSMIDEDSEDKILFSIFNSYLEMRYN